MDDQGFLAVEDERRLLAELVECRGTNPARAAEVRNELALAHLWLVRKYMCRLPIRDQDRDDVAQEGFLALVSCVKSWKPECANGARFSTYADYRVRNRVYREYRKRTRVTTDPRQKALDLEVSSEVGAIELGIDALHLLECVEGIEREILVRNYGLDGCGGQTLEAIGEAIGVTRQRVYQRKSTALARIRRAVA